MNTLTNNLLEELVAVEKEEFQIGNSFHAYKFRIEEDEKDEADE